MNVQLQHNKVKTPYGTLRFSSPWDQDRSRSEVVIDLHDNNTKKFLGEFGYGFYDTCKEAEEEIRLDIEKLVKYQVDAKKMYGITDE